MIPIYQSPQSSVPCRKGTLYSPDTLLPKPKLARYIGSTQLLVNISPLLASVMHSVEDARTSVGVRLKAERMTMDMYFEQLPFTVKKAVENAPDMIGSATRWSLEASEIQFAQLEARAVTILSCTLKHPDLSKMDMDDIETWIMSADKGVKSCSFIMYPFIWAPHFIYFKRTENPKVQVSANSNSRDSEFLLKNNAMSCGMESLYGWMNLEINSVQISLLRDRLNQLESLIAMYMTMQQSLYDLCKTSKNAQQASI
jgi:RNA pol II promoter Fmp27 protein domain